mgnify:CR=1 FL=1
MNWKNIKTFLIILFLIINIYLIYSQYGFDFKSPNASYVNKDTLNDSVSIIKNNYNVNIDKNIIPEKMKFKLIIVEAFKADYPKPAPDYFYNETHIDYFRYSPDCSDRIIETIF